MMNLSEEIAAIFDCMIDSYSQIFSHYYPAHNSTGFTERNLTCNFAFAIKSLYPNDSFIWFEAPIDLKNSKHVDAVAFIPSKKAMLIIEAKRFSNLKQKIREIEEDIERIQNLEHYYLLKTGLVGSIVVEFAIGIILSDIWLETDGKTRWFQQWHQICTSSYGAEMTRIGEFCKLSQDWSLKKNYKVMLAAFTLKIPATEQ